MMYGFELKKCDVCGEAPAKSKSSESPATVSVHGTTNISSSNSVHVVVR